MMNILVFMLLLFFNGGDDDDDEYDIGVHVGVIFQFTFKICSLSMTSDTWKKKESGLNC